MQCGLELQRPADSQIVLARLELAAQFGKRPGNVGCCLARAHPEVQEESLDPGMGVLPVVAGGGGDALGVAERGSGLLELSGFYERRAQVRIEPPENRVVTRKERGR